MLSPLHHHMLTLPGYLTVLSCTQNPSNIEHDNIHESEMAGCHGMTSLPLPCPPLATSDPFHLCSAPSASTPLQLRSMLVQLTQLHHAHSQTNHRSILNPLGPGSHAKGCCLYTLSTFVLFA